MKIKKITVEVAMEVYDLPQKALDLLDRVEDAGGEEQKVIIDALEKMGYSVEMEYGEIIEVTRMLEMIRPDDGN